MDEVDEVRGKLDSYLEKHEVYSRLREILGSVGGSASRQSSTATLAPTLLAALRKQMGAPAMAVSSTGRDRDGDVPEAAPASSQAYAELNSRLLRGSSSGSGQHTHLTGSRHERRSHMPAHAPTHTESLKASRTRTRTSAEVVADASQMQDRRRLVFRLTGGRAFTSYLHEAAPPHSQQFLVVHVQFCNQRFQSDPVPANVDPAFDSVFVMDLMPAGSFGSVADMPTLLRMDKRLHVCVTRITCFSQPPYSSEEGTDPGAGAGTGAVFPFSADLFSGEVSSAAPPSGSSAVCSVSSVSVELVSTAELEWRGVLATGEQSVAVELAGVGHEAKIGVPVGVLLAQLSLAPFPASVAVLPAAEVSVFIRDQMERDADVTRRFFKYARDWWKEFQDIHPSFASRQVKLLVEDSAGTRWPSCCFVRPAMAGRLLSSAGQAARLVSLIPHLHHTSPSALVRAEVWQPPHITLALRHGDVECHASLLCSLLLGFGLCAYVAVGTRVDPTGLESDHVWVVTVDGDGVGAAAGDGRPEQSPVMFWEALTGQRIPPTATSPSGHQYLRLGCVFNHTELYANKQRSDLVRDCAFNLSDDRCWKAMDSTLLVQLRHVEGVCLSPPSIDVTSASESIQSELKHAISAHRVSCGLNPVPFDDPLEYLLGSALSSYEMERVLGVALPNPDFRAAVKRIVARGFTFKAFPIVFNHMSPSKALSSLLSTRVGKDVVQARGDHLRLAVAVSVVAYPNNFCAVWVMVAATYRPHDALAGAPAGSAADTRMHAPGSRMATFVLDALGSEQAHAYAHAQADVDVFGARRLP